MPGTFSELLGNIFLYRISYNGAWWFVVTYVFLQSFSPLLIKLTDKLNPLILIGLSGLLYFIAYVFRFNFPITMQNVVLDWFWQQLILFGTSQFSYMMGMVCRRMRWVTRLRVYLRGNPINRSKYVWLAEIGIIILPVVTFLGHCVIQSLIVAPITAASVLVCLFAFELPIWLHRFLLLMGKHSTNIWLIHMFFYLTLFERFVFVARYPLLILALMLVVCICISCQIGRFEKMLWKYIKRGS